MVEPSSLPHSSSSPPSGRSSRETFPELSQSLEDQGVELGIILSIQPLSSHAPPSDTGSPYESSSKSHHNTIQTSKISLTFDSPQGLVIDPFVVSHYIHIVRMINFVFHWSCLLVHIKIITSCFLWS